MAKNLFVYSYETITTFLISNQIDGKKEKQAFVFSLSKGQLFHSTEIMANTKNFTKTLQIPSTSLLISWAASEHKWIFILKFATGHVKWCWAASTRKKNGICWQSYCNFVINCWKTPHPIKLGHFPPERGEKLCFIDFFTGSMSLPDSPARWKSEWGGP